MSVSKRGAFYHYRFKSRGQLHAGVCRDEAGNKIKHLREAEKAEKRVRELVSKLDAQETVKGIVENYKRILVGGNPIALPEAWNRFLAKPRKKAMSTRHREQVESRWHDFVHFMADNHNEVCCMHEVARQHAEEYIAFLDAKGPYTDFYLAPTAKDLDIPVSTLKRYMKESAWPESGTLRDKRNYVKQQAARLAPKHRAKRRSFSRPACKKISPQSRNNYLNTCSMIFEALAADAGCVDNPFNGIPKAKLTAESREAFTPEELKLIGEKATGWIYTLFMVGVNTGLREGDICTLRWDEVDLDGGWITRRMSKTSKAVEIPILPALKKHLESLPHDGEYCFPELADRYKRKRTTIGQYVREFLETLNISTTRAVPGRTRAVSIKDVHSCRHTFVYLAALHGIPLPVVQKIVGHVSDEMTRKYSDHAQRREIAETMSKMPDYMIGAANPELPQARLQTIVYKVKMLSNEKLGRLEGFLAELESGQNI
jgi:integrase